MSTPVYLWANRDTAIDYHVHLQHEFREVKSMEQFILGLKRGSVAPDDWIYRLQRLPGVRLLATPTNRTARIEVGTPEAEVQVRAAVEGFCNVEPLMAHSRH